MQKDPKELYKFIQYLADRLQNKKLCPVKKSIIQKEYLKAIAQLKKIMK